METSLKLSTSDESKKVNGTLHQKLLGRFELGMVSRFMNASKYTDWKATNLQKESSSISIEP
jgi:hypothetical protein